MRNAVRHLNAIAIWCIFLFTVFPVSCCYGWYGKVVTVEDGVNLEVAREGGKVRVHLYGIKCPEKGQPFGTKAVYVTCFLTLGKHVEVIPIGLETGRVISALVKVRGDRESINSRLIGYGMAWVKNRDSAVPLSNAWKKIEGFARLNKIGVWAHKNSAPAGQLSNKRSKKAIQIDG
jgi:micrococcal nuclease